MMPRDKLAASLDLENRIPSVLARSSGWQMG